MLIKMPVKGKKEIQFWLHAFHLEKEIENIAMMLNQDVRRRTGFCPILTEYEAGEMFFHIILGATVDPLGLSDGAGFVWLTTGEKHKDLAEKDWRKIGDEVLKSAQESGKWDETFEIESGREV
jgi:hypothetical protein